MSALTVPLRIKRVSVATSFVEDCDDAGLSDFATRVHLAAILWTSRRGLPTVDEYDIPRFTGKTHEERMAAVDDLVSAGFWERVGAESWAIIHGMPERRAPRPQDLPNCADGTWSGSADLDRNDPAPPTGMSVVYMLIDDRRVVYVGSTNDFRARLRCHVAEKQFSTWKAKDYVTRSNAYRAEFELIRQARPPLNIVHNR